MEFQIKNFKYRTKKMNAIELLALRSIINFGSVEQVTKCYNSLLERVEVQVKDDKWLQVKQGDAYFPADVENDFETIEALVANMLEYVRSVFQKSDASN